MRPRSSCAFGPTAWSRQSCWFVVLSVCLPALACSSSTGKLNGGAAANRGDAGSEDDDWTSMVGGRAARDGGGTRSDGTDGTDDADDNDAGPRVSTNKPDADASGCGDGRLQPGEACDDGNDRSGDGCSADCKQRERDYICPAPGEPCVFSAMCGDGRIAGSESCDDGNLRKGDGCDAECKLEPGYACPKPNALCVAAKCGDHLVAGSEQCDDDDDMPTDGDGCSATCVREANWVCPTPGKPCRQTSCNDGKKEGSEACDDGNSVGGDGCNAFCEVEPDCSAGPCTSRCGDGLLLPNSDEVCDDGNLADGDGCSATCKPEPGYACALAQTSLPDTLQVGVVYRDFIAYPNGNLPQHPDFQRFSGSDVTPGLVMPLLTKEQKPVYAQHCDDAGAPYPDYLPLMGDCPYNQQLTTPTAFYQWYRDVTGVNTTKTERMSLTRDPAGSTYRVEQAAFFPWDNDPRSWVELGVEEAVDGHNYGFTSEIHTYFEYKPSSDNPPTLTFTGDDDVWVFINRRLAVDIGGLHPELGRSVTLDAATATTLQIEAGKIYEMALFHAERHNPDSHFNLSLEGFLAAGSRCQPTCGDSVMAGRESCDDGKNDGSYGSCTADCQRAAYCGDGRVDMPQETCDDGINITTYSADGKPGCAPGCKPSAFCGDGQIDGMAGEQCDDGKNKGGYGNCGSSCQFGPRCGDGELQRDHGETCDDGNQVGADGCSKDCKVETPD